MSLSKAVIGFRVHGLGLQGVGFIGFTMGLGIQGLGFMEFTMGLGLQGLGFIGFRARVLGCRVTSESENEANDPT